MAGLFWITPETVYLGAPPSTTPSAVTLGPTGLTILGPQAGFWLWKHIAGLTVEDAPTRSTMARSLAAALAVILGPQSPTEMTVRLETTDGSKLAIPVHSAAAFAYTICEVDLSQGLLDQMVRGKTSPASFTKWLRTSACTRPLRPAKREALLHHWMENS
ncbi:hypothetical protein [Streptomyces sp. NPDC015414]|uniref:hypothetical protein n=1 Tax=Streptomyces sp. NPDC015414 TaxID=3364957 RepID=UPI003702DD04